MEFFNQKNRPMKNIIIRATSKHNEECLKHFENMLKIKLISLRIELYQDNRLVLELDDGKTMAAYCFTDIENDFIRYHNTTFPLA